MIANQQLLSHNQIELELSKSLQSCDFNLKQIVHKTEKLKELYKERFCGEIT